MDNMADIVRAPNILIGQKLSIVRAVLQRRRASIADTKGYEMICNFTLVERRERKFTEGTASNAILQV